MTPEALAEALYVTAVPSRTDQTADEIGPGRSSEERRRARLARFTEWAEVILAHPAVQPAPAPPADDQRGPRWHVQFARPGALPALGYGMPGSPEVFYPDLSGWPDEAVQALSAMSRGAWASGFDSGYGEGRKAASTAKMLGVFRVFDPRPLVAALATYDTLTDAWDREAVALADAVRQALVDAEVPTAPPEPVPDPLFDVLAVDGAVVSAGVSLEEALRQCLDRALSNPSAPVNPPPLHVRVAQ